MIMVKKLKYLLPLLVPALFTACVDDQNDTQQTVVEPYVQRMVLGGLKRVMHTTTKTGRDSIYKVSVAGTTYPLYIDQINNRIYNPDSLPVRTDASKVVFSALNYAGNAIAIRTQKTNIDSLFVTTDSTDFSVPRQLTVYGNSADVKRTYTVTINVHREEAEAFRWKRSTAAELADVDVSRTLIKDGQLYVFGTRNNVPVVLQGDAATPEQLRATATGRADLDPRSVQLAGNAFYALAGTSLVRSEDGRTWTALTPSVAVTALAMSDGTRMIGVAGGKLYASTDGVTWTAEPLDLTDGTLPSEGFTGSVNDYPSDPKLKDYLLLGTADGRLTSWKRVYDTTGSQNLSWTYFPSVTSGSVALPATLTRATAVAYGTGTVLGGMDGTTPAPLRWSLDNGRTWRADAIASPACTGTSIALATDKDAYIYIVLGGSGEVWRGRQNQLGWQTHGTTFTNARAMSAGNGE